jgi:hypothetical protein
MLISVPCFNLELKRGQERLSKAISAPKENAQVSITVTEIFWAVINPTCISKLTLVHKAGHSFIKLNNGHKFFAQPVPDIIEALESAFEEKQKIELSRKFNIGLEQAMKKFVYARSNTEGTSLTVH